MIKVISTEAQMVRDLKLVFQGSVKDTKTMRDVHDYSLMVVEKVNPGHFAIYGNLYVRFFTNNKGERCYKYSHEVILHDFIKCQSFSILKKKQVESSRVMTWNDSSRIGSNTFTGLAIMVGNEFNTLSK